MSVIVALLSLSCTGCSTTETYGDSPDEKTVRTPLSAIFLSPQEYINKEVVVEGVITSECPTGGFIYVRDQSGHDIYVEMHGTSFAPIPQRTGRKVIVKGLVFQSEGSSKEVKLLGKGVLIR
jgi:hypothetical protein